MQQNGIESLQSAGH